MAIQKKKSSELFDDLKEGLEAAINLAHGKRVRGTRVSAVTITPVRKLSAAQIKTLRTKLGMTQALFAKVLGVTTKAVEAWEAGTKNPSGPVLRMFEILAKEAQILEKVGIYTRRESA